MSTVDLRGVRMALLDLDGTLIDTAPDIADCVDDALRAVGVAPRGEDKTRLWIGNGVQRLIERALTDDIDGEPDRTLFEKAYAIFTDLYARRLCVRSTLYPGVREGLAGLKARGVRLGCVTNKLADFTDPLLARVGIAGDFELVLSGDSLPRKKPDPLPLLHAAEWFGVTQAESLMVGDSQNDVRAARAAGFPVVCVDYGYNHGQDIRDSGPDAVIHSLADLPALLEPAT